jgi:hypothetical protein
MIHIYVNTFLTMQYFLNFSGQWAALQFYIVALTWLRIPLLIAETLTLFSFIVHTGRVMLYHREQSDSMAKVRANISLLFHFVNLWLICNSAPLKRQQFYPWEYLVTFA